MKHEPARRSAIYTELDRLSALAMAAGKDFNDELTLILNRANNSLEMIGDDHPASVNLVELQHSIARCAEITRCLMLLTLQARESLQYATLH